MKKILFTLLLFYSISKVGAVTNMIVYSTDSSYQTGQNLLISTPASSITTVTSTYTIVYGFVMGTSSLSAAIGVMSNSFQMTNLVFGWKLVVVYAN